MIAARRPDSVQALALASPGYREEPPHILEALEAIRGMAMRHKNGNGDCSGRLDDETLDAALQYFFSDDMRLANRKELYLASLQMRCQFRSLVKSRH